MGDEDKQFEASHQKLEKARKEGQVVKSKDFSTAVAMIVMFFAIAKLSPFIFDQISRLFVLCYEQIPNKHLGKYPFAVSFVYYACAYRAHHWANSCFIYVYCNYRGFYSGRTVVYYNTACAKTRQT